MTTSPQRPARRRTIVAAIGTVAAFATLALSATTAEAVAGADDIPLWTRLDDLSAAQDHNDAGHILGRDHDQRPVRRDPDGTHHHITLPGYWVETRDLNAYGHIVGSAHADTDTPGVRTLAYLWRDGTFTVLPDLGGEFSIANAMSDAGHVVGYAEEAGPGWTTDAWIWTAETGTVNLGDGQATSVAVDVNDSGVAVGHTTTTIDGPTIASVWYPGEPRMELGTLGGEFSTAHLITDDGTVIGTSQVGGGAVHMFTWTRTGGMVDRGRIGDFISPNDVNDAGVVVGAYFTDTGGEGVPSSSFMWTAAGGFRHLDVPSPAVPGFSAAQGVDNFNNVVGTFEEAEQGAYYWQPRGGDVPTPPTPAPRPATPVPAQPRFTG